jgi:SH3 domain
LAIGIILIIALFVAGALWFYRKKKKDNEELRSADNEKVGGFGAPFAGVAMKTQSRKSVGIRAQKPDSSAPRLSLRPVTQFIPDLAAAKKRISQGNPLNMMNKPAGMAAAGAGRHLTRDNPTASPWERRAGGNSNASNPFNDPPVNPFGDQAKAAAPPPNVTVTPPPSDDGSATGAGTGVGAVAGVGAAAGVGAVAGAAGAAMAAGAGRKGNEQPQRAKGSPEGARMAAGGPPPGNVHRVQLDFQPSMEDELELRAGQLIRILHEYDDGWVWSCHP